MRLARPSGLITLVSVAFVVALSIMVTNCGSDEATTTSSGSGINDTMATTSTSEAVSTTGTSATTSTTVSSTTTTEALSSAETLLPNGNIRAMGYIGKVWEADGRRYIRIDFAEMLVGEEANAAAVEAGIIAPGEDVPNDYFIRNVNPQKREFTVSGSVEITTDTSGGGMDNPVTWPEFKSFWSASPPAGSEHLRDMPWWIERTAEEVISIAEQYLP